MPQNEIPVAEKITPPAQGGATSQASGRAIITLILGVLSLICAGFMAGIPAIILGVMELKAIKAGQAPVEGESLTKIGLILGVVGTVITVLALLAFIAIIALGISLGASGALSEITQTAI